VNFKQVRLCVILSYFLALCCL